MDRYSYEDDFEKVLDLLFHVVQSSIRDFQGLEPWYSNAHALALKLFRHLSTVYRLCTPHQDRTTGDMIVDHSSVYSLTRTAFETFLTFAFIFGAPNRELTRFRYALWQRAGLLERRKYADARTPAQAEQLASEWVSIEELTAEIEASPLFNTEYTERQRTRLIEKNEWTGVHKANVLAEKAGMHPDYFRKIYKHTSGHTHSSYISALQVNQARNVKTQMELAKYCLGVGLLVMTHFLAMFVSMSPMAKVALESHQHTKHLFERWNIQREDWDKL